MSDFKFTCWSCTNIRIQDFTGQPRYDCILKREEYPYLGGQSCPSFSYEPGSDEQEIGRYKED